MGRNIRPKKNMALEIQKYPTFLLTKRGRLTRVNLQSLDGYNHYEMHLHHFIPYESFIQNPDWYADNGINQKLILVPIPVHEQLHNQGTGSLSEDDFIEKYGIAKNKLIFRR